ncbi:MAG: hypothetical protein AAF499_18645, partial [Pseudomonadota bacterium]
MTSEYVNPKSTQADNRIAGENVKWQHTEATQTVNPFRSMKRKRLAPALAILLAAVLATMGWQHSRYSDIRLEFAQDR